MSNILIIKHGSLGDIVQISGVLKDIRETHKSDQIIMLTTPHYIDLLSKCPFIDGALIDRRLPRWNILYLLRLKKLIKKFNFSHVYDLQNSSRTSFYRRYIFKISKWCSTETVLSKEDKKSDFDKDSVLERFKKQLESFNVQTKHSLKPDFSWACSNVDKIVNKYFGKKFILIFPFSSSRLSNKIWPYFNELIKIIKSKHDLDIATAPGQKEIENAKKIDATAITNNEKSLNIMELAGLVKKSSFVISNDTGPAHIAAHLGIKGIAIFGQHTTPKKVSIETENFRAIQVKNLGKLSAENVYSEIEKDIELIN